MRYMLLSLVLSSTLILYENGDHSGQQLVRTTSDPTLVNDGWNDRVSAIRVTGRCQWILYQDSNYDGTSSVIGPGDQNYHHTIFGIPNDELSSVRCLPPSNFRAIALFQHALYGGIDMRVLCSSSQNLVGFDNTVSSFIINMGVWDNYFPLANFALDHVFLECQLHVTCEPVECQFESMTSSVPREASR